MSISVISFAQTKDEMFIAGTVSADLGTQKTTLGAKLLYFNCGKANYCYLWKS